MTKYFLCTLLVGAMLAAAALAQAQSRATLSPPPGNFDVALSYTATQGDLVGGSRFWMQGGSVDLHYSFLRSLGAVADITGAHQANIHSSSVGLDLITATFGPRYTWTAQHGRYALFGQALGGVAAGRNSVFPSATGVNSSASAPAMKLGGGLNIKLSPHLTLRAFQAHWLYTRFPNANAGFQNSFLTGAGMDFRFP